MKKITLVFVALAAQINFAQSIFPTDAGNVGIGTILPTNSLTIRKTPDQNSAHIYFGEPTAISGQPSASLCFGGSGIQNSGFTWVPNGTDTGKLHLSFGGYDNGIKNPIKMTFQSNGNVGIGTTTPLWGLLQLASVGDASTALRLDVGGFSMNGQAKFMIDSPGIGGGRFTVSESGNVGIGISNPLNKLEVRGTIHSQEVKVDMLGWSDFVFKKEYNLPTLEEVEKHIVENGHLENIPSEEEVLENGINLGEMNAKLLQKIEELTLYIIEQEKKNKLQSHEIDFLKIENQKFQSLLERVVKLENQSK